MVQYVIEIKFIICCARTYVDSKTVKEIEYLITLELDWDYIIRCAAQHGIIPLLYQNLRSICPDMVPTQYLDEFRNLSHKTALYNLIVISELLKLNHLFNKNKIEIIPFKGPILAASVYGNPTLRQYGDLDILVREKDYPNTIALMNSEGGYQLTSRKWHFLNQTKENQYIRHEPEFSLSNGTVTVDLHQKLIKPDFFVSKYFEFDNLFRRSQPISLSNHSLTSLCPEDLLLYLCIHGSKERWRSLKWIVDIAEVIRHYPEINWDYLVNKSHTERIERMFFVGLALAKDILDTPLPEIVEHKINNTSVIQKISQKLSENLFKNPGEIEIYSEWKTIYLYLSMMVNLWDKLNVIFRFRIRSLYLLWSPNTKDSEFIQLPTSLYFLYYFIRPFRLLVQRM
jgi:pterin-4a-carbinolamine dehydratase